MKLKKNLSLLFIFTVAMCAFAQNPKRDVVFMLNPNEAIHGNEYYLLQNFNQNRFSCLIYNTSTYENTFVFNGKRIQTAPWILVQYLNVNEENGYIISYYKRTENGIEWYINNKGNVEGPFDTVWFDDDYDYCYALAGRSWGHKNGRNELIQEKKRTYCGYYENTWYVYDDVQYREYDNVEHLRLTEKFKNGRYAYYYKENGKYYANINGHIYGAYDGIYVDGGSPFYIDNDGNFGYRYYLQGTVYKKRNTKEEIVCFGRHSYLSDIEIHTTNNNHSFYSSYEYEYVVIDGRPFGTSPAIQVWYDEKKSSFIWTGIEGRELVVYEYKMD